MSNCWDAIGIDTSPWWIIMDQYTLYCMIKTYDWKFTMGTIWTQIIHYYSSVFD